MHVPQGTISYNILTEVLKYLDQLNIFENAKTDQPPLDYWMAMEVDSSYCSWNTKTPKTPDGIRDWIQTLRNLNVANV